MAYDVDLDKLTFIGAGTDTVVFLDIATFLSEHGAYAVRVTDHDATFLVYDEEGTLTWVAEDSLERQTTADIKSVPTKKPS